MLRAALIEANTGLKEIARFVRALSRLRSEGLPYGMEVDLELAAGLATSHVRLFEHTGAVIRTYSLFERLVIRLAEAWIQWCLKTTASSILDNEQCRSAYESGLAEIFRRRTEPRFSDIDLFELSRAHSMFSPNHGGASSIQIEPFTASLPNFKLDHVVTLFANVALGNPSEWLNQSERLLQLRDEHQLNHAEALKNLVELRNEVAHGNPAPDEIIGVNELLARIEFVSALATSLYEFTISRAAELEAQREGANCLLGTVTHRWPAAGAFQLTTASSVLASGEQVLVVDKGFIAVDAVKSIQLEGVRQLGWTGRIGTDLGLVMSAMPPAGAKLYRLSAVREDRLLLS